MGKGAKDTKRSDRDIASLPAAHKDDDLTGILSERLQNFSDAITELDEALGRRKCLSDKFLREIEEEAANVMRHIKGLNPPWKTGFHPELEFLRLSLHKSLTSRQKDIRSEELKYWEDVTQLVKDRRKLLDDYRALLAMTKRLRE